MYGVHTAAPTLAEADHRVPGLALIFTSILAGRPALMALVRHAISESRDPQSARLDPGAACLQRRLLCLIWGLIEPTGLDANPLTAPACVAAPVAGAFCD